MAKTNWTFEYISNLSNYKLYYVYYWLNKQDKDFFNNLGFILGTYWTKERIEQLKSEGDPSAKSESGDITMPLSLILQPSFKDSLIEAGNRKPVIGQGDYKPAPDEEVEDMMKWSKEDYRAFFEGRHTDISRRK